MVLLADDMRADTIAAHGNPNIKTPNIDALVRSGTSFHRCYIQGGNSGAVCIPSRAMLLTGRSWLQINTDNLRDTDLLPEWFSTHGYTTFGTGKWHNGKESWLRSFKKGRSVFMGGMSDHTKVPISELTDAGQLSEPKISGTFSSELFADATIDFLEHHDRATPFLAYVAFTAPHDPRQPPENFVAPYYKNLPPAPKNFLPKHPFDNGMLNNLRDENLAPWPRPETMIREQIAEYYGLITHMDFQIGRILKSLDESGLRDNTIIVFASDNGLALGSHGLLGKQNVYEHSMRVPLIISGPNIPINQKTDAMSYLLDLFPTLCELASLPQPSELHGKSLHPILSGELQSVRDTIFLPYMKIQRAIRDERWKLICYPKIQYLQLFDLQNDPHETQNLIDNHEFRGEAERLLNQLRDWQQTLGDRVSISSERSNPKPFDFSNQKRPPDRWQPDWIIKKYFGPTPN